MEVTVQNTSLLTLAQIKWISLDRPNVPRGVCRSTPQPIITINLFFVIIYFVFLLGEAEPIGFCPFGTDPRGLVRLAHDSFA